MATAYDTFLERLRRRPGTSSMKPTGSSGVTTLDVMNALDEPGGGAPTGDPFSGSGGPTGGSGPQGDEGDSSFPGQPPPGGGGGGGGGGFPNFGGLFGGGGGSAGAGSTAGAIGASTPWYNTVWGQTLIKFGLGALANRFLGGKTGSEKNLEQFSTAGFGSPKIQRFLPLALQAQFTEPLLSRGIQGIGELLMNPGGLSPSVSEAILPRLAMESESIGQNFRNLRSEQAGAAARGNLPVSIKAALQSALGIGEERAQRDLRRTALSESEDLRRQDLDQVYKLLDALLQFTSSGRGQAIQGLRAASQTAQQRQASQLALIGSLLSADWGGSGGGSRV